VEACGFGITCSLALVAGLLIRTHNLLTPSLTGQVGEITGQGLPQMRLTLGLPIRT
jgi:hypothetical protein